MKGQLTIRYDGYWQCRQATDPDPSWDPRGVSGYTFAVGWESDLDQIIRLQRDEIAPRDFRVVPGEPSSQRFGVFVTGVEFGGSPWLPGLALVQGPVRWLPAGLPDAGPRFEMRNTVTYFPVKDGIFMPICPFEIQVAGTGGAVLLSRDDPLDPADPSRQIWQIADPEDYRRRCPRRFVHRSDEVLRAIGLAGQEPDAAFNNYFVQREEWLGLAIDELEVQHARGVLETADYRVRRQGLAVRREAVSNSDSFEDRLGLMAEWDHDLVGTRIVAQGEELLRGQVSRDEPWHVRFWLGGFDGDLMRGYMRGVLTIPFTPGTP